MIYFGYRKAAGQILALEKGQAAPARLVDVYRDTTVVINGRSPWKLEYLFSTPSGEHGGWVHAWENTHSQRPSGEAFWVVYLPDDPEQNTPWPPVK